jgi:hypothetical protein
MTAKPSITSTLDSHVKLRLRFFTDEMSFHQLGLALSGSSILGNAGNAHAKESNDVEGPYGDRWIL